MRITSKEINQLQDCSTLLENYAMEVQQSGYQSSIKISKSIIKKAMFLDKFVAKILNAKRR
jgi:hypothetical protein